MKLEGIERFGELAPIVLFMVALEDMPSHIWSGALEHTGGRLYRGSPVVVTAVVAAAPASTRRSRVGGEGARSRNGGGDLIGRGLFIHVSLETMLKDRDSHQHTQL